MAGQMWDLAAVRRVSFPCFNI